MPIHPGGRWGSRGGTLTPWVAPQEQLPDLVIDEDEEAVWEGAEPPGDPVRRRERELARRAAPGTQGTGAGDRWEGAPVVGGKSGPTHLRGYIRRATPIPGQYDRKAARAVSSRSPKIRILFLGESKRRRLRGAPGGRWQSDLHGQGQSTSRLEFWERAVLVALRPGQGFLQAKEEGGLPNGHLACLIGGGCPALTSCPAGRRNSGASCR